jgi:hypothetical protein
MKQVRVVVPLLAAVLVIGGWLLAEDPKKADPTDPPVKLRGTLPAHWKSLGLTDGQKQQVYKVRATYTAKIDALRDQIRALVDAEKDELEKLLTEAQKLRLRELKLGETTPKDPTKPPDTAKPPEPKPADPKKDK